MNRKLKLMGDKIVPHQRTAVTQSTSILQGILNEPGLGNPSVSVPRSTHSYFCATSHTVRSGAQRLSHSISQNYEESEIHFSEKNSVQNEVTENYKFVNLSLHFNDMIATT